MNDTSPTPTYQAVLITPELAAEWLKRNTHNRPLNDARVDQLAGAMKRGEWRENGDSIRFDWNDVLLDGQKRLEAVVKTRVSIPALVVRNLPPETQLTMDTGQPRSFAQALVLRGISDANQVSALARRIWAWENGELHSKRSYQATYEQLLNLVDNQLPSLQESIAVATKVYRTVPVTKTTLGLTHWLFKQIDENDTTFFFERLGDGVGLQAEDPILVLRNALLSVLHMEHRPNPNVLLAWIIKAWNSYRAGEQIRNIYYRAGGASPEQFPEPK